MDEQDLESDPRLRDRLSRLQKAWSLVTQPGSKNPNWKGGRSVTGDGYVLVKAPDHPDADCRGYVYEHRKVAMETLGRALLPGEEVHHRNLNRADNRPDNLIVKKSRAEHRLAHRSKGSRLRRPGAPNPRIACACGCGQELDQFDRIGRPRRMISGHNFYLKEHPRGRY